jgi:hypothetical protein
MVSVCGFLRPEKLRDVTMPRCSGSSIRRQRWVDNLIKDTGRSSGEEELL